jgi:hypothetical protein
MSGITDRIDAALQKLAFRQMEVRRIYLDEEDDAAFVKAVTRYWRKELKSTATRREKCLNMTNRCRADHRTCR